MLHIYYIYIWKITSKCYLCTLSTIPVHQKKKQKKKVHRKRWLDTVNDVKFSTVHERGYKHVWIGKKFLWIAWEIVVNNTDNERRTKGLSLSICSHFNLYHTFYGENLAKNQKFLKVCYKIRFNKVCLYHSEIINSNFHLSSLGCWRRSLR